MQISQKMQVIFRLSDTLPLTVFPAFAWGSQEGEISKLLSPLSLLWELLRSRGYFALDLCGFVGVEMMG
jgi:hypothetical protein